MSLNRPLKSLVAASLALGLMASSSALAQTAAQSDPVADALRQRGEANRQAPDSVQTPEEQRTTSALNAEILDQNDLAEMEERARLADYAKAQADYQAELERVAAENERIARETAEHEARYKAEMEAHARARADWEACNAGDRSRCRPQ
ncbi:MULTISPECIES: cell wall hydrolase [unclassified Brevundimonas]|uniref:cell wall hydrolase n=1 Tax=unclassified Brevundimonas TaxID=2622653 RepID=UPI0025BD99FE|nr:MULTISPECIES: cell wall hydrolase [unclassified Brevundimonas]